MKQKLSELRGERDSAIVIVRDISTHSQYSIEQPDSTKE